MFPSYINTFPKLNSEILTSTSACQQKRNDPMSLFQRSALQSAMLHRLKSGILDIALSHTLRIQALVLLSLEVPPIDLKVIHFYHLNCYSSRPSHHHLFSSNLLITLLSTLICCPHYSQHDLIKM